MNDNNPAHARQRKDRTVPFNQLLDGLFNIDRVAARFALVVDGVRARVRLLGDDAYDDEDAENDFTCLGELADELDGQLRLVGFLEDNLRIGLGCADLDCSFLQGLDDLREQVVGRDRTLDFDIWLDNSLVDTRVAARVLSNAARTIRRTILGA